VGQEREEAGSLGCARKDNQKNNGNGKRRYALEAVAQTRFDAAAVVRGVGDAEERGAEDAAYLRDVGVVQQVRGTDIGSERLLVIGLGIA
jgi:hypothetical protein